MVIAIIELPAEGIFKVKVDEQQVRGHIRRSDEGEKWEIWLAEDAAVPLRTKPLSREAAAALCVYHHFETERRRLRERQLRDRKAAGGTTS